MVLVQMFSFFGKCEFVYLVFLGLVAVVFLHATTPLCFHLLAVLFCTLKIWLRTLLLFPAFLDVWLRLILQLLVCIY